MNAPAARSDQRALRTLVRQVIDEDRARDGVRALCGAWNSLKDQGVDMGPHPLTQTSTGAGFHRTVWGFTDAYEGEDGTAFQRRSRGELRCQPRKENDSPPHYLYSHSDYARRRAALELGRMARWFLRSDHIATAINALRTMLSGDPRS